MNAKEMLRELWELARRHGSPVVVTFITRHCGWGACDGYHPVEAVEVCPDGRIFHHPSPYGLHSLIDPPPKPRLVSEREAVELLADLLVRERRATRTPFLSWEDVLGGAEFSENERLP